MNMKKFRTSLAVLLLATTAAPASASFIWVEGFGQNANYALAEAEAIAMGESDCIDIGGNPTISTVYEAIHYPTFWWVNTLTRCNLP
jgi:hypothetical protein